MRAFTLIEMVVVLGLIGVIASFTAFQDLPAYTRLLTRTDAETIRMALAKARSDSLHGVCSGEVCDEMPPHGVRITAHEVTVFEGPSYEGRIESADLSFPLEGVAADVSVHDVVFAPGTGAPTQPEVLSHTDSSEAVWNIDIEESGALEVHLEAPTSSTVDI